MKNLSKNSIVLINPYQLKPHEKISISRAIYILFKIILVGNFTVPLLVDSKTKTIIDGHHRCWVAKKLKFKSVPCYCVDYLSDQSIRVHPRRANISVDKMEVINMALGDNLFPRKTTRHEYKIPVFKSLSLGELWK